MKTEEIKLDLLIKKIEIFGIELNKQKKAIDERLAKVDYYESELKKYISETNDVIKKYQGENAEIKELQRLIAELAKKAHTHPTIL